MKINKEKMTPEFLKEFAALRGRQQEEIFWHGSVDWEGGFQLMHEHMKQWMELGKKYGVIEEEQKDEG